MNQMSTPHKIAMNTIPLSLYIHIPWCIKKCPYCDFNSHANSQDTIAATEAAYIDRLIDDLRAHTSDIQNRPIQTIFIGGGTPSLLSATAYARLFNVISTHCQLDNAVEITLEANPSSIEQKRFADYRALGINRLSIGVQSFEDSALKQLGRIHDSACADKAIRAAQRAGFKRINLDIMYGLPAQTPEAALADLQQALRYNTEHISWYQLTIEPNTVFYRYRPSLPNEDTIIDMDAAGQQLLTDAGLTRYEISAYCHSNAHCQHNVNYWRYGDYLGIGAGAHSKLTDITSHTITRFAKAKQPTQYLNPDKKQITQQHTVTQQERVFEFMLNALRLLSPTDFADFEQRTGLSKHVVLPLFAKAKQHGWLDYDKQAFCPTQMGYRYLNDLTALFLP